LARFLFYTFLLFYYFSFASLILQVRLIFWQFFSFVQQLSVLVSCFHGVIAMSKIAALIVCVDELLKSAIHTFFLSVNNPSFLMLVVRLLSTSKCVRPTFGPSKETVTSRQPRVDFTIFLILK
jgi:hypothetical protein